MPRPARPNVDGPTMGYPINYQSPDWEHLPSASRQGVIAKAQNLIREKRPQATQKEIGEEVGIPQQRVSDVLQGRNFSAACQICEVLGGLRVEGPRYLLRPM